MEYCFMLIINYMIVSRHSPVGIVTGYGLDGRGSIPGRDKIFSLLHIVQISSGAYTASYPKGTGGAFHGDKAAGV
jgi:hypothetical protein